MNLKFTIVSICKTGAGILESKFKLLSPFEEVDRIIIVRKGLGYVISKVHYRFLPKICKNPLIKKLITPFVIMEEVKKHKAKFSPAYLHVPQFGLAFIASMFTGTPYILARTGSDAEKLALRPLRGNVSEIAYTESCIFVLKHYRIV